MLPGQRLWWEGRGGELSDLAFADRMLHLLHPLKATDRKRGSFGVLPLVRSYNRTVGLHSWLGTVTSPPCVPPRQADG